MSAFSSVLSHLERSFDPKSYLADCEHKEHGANWSFRCPMCEREDKLWVLVEENGDRLPGTWICFYCDEAGTSVDLIRMLEGCDLFSALKILKELSKKDESSDLRSAVEKALSGFVDVAPSGSVPLEGLPEEFLSCRMAVRDGKLFPSYFKERGVSQIKSTKYGLGWCPSGRYRNRMVVPIKKNGKLRWFTARWMAKIPPSGQKKYLNSIGSRASETLFAIDFAKNSKRIVIVEDVFSAMALGNGAVAACGTHFSKEQFLLLAGTDAEEVVVFLDEDAENKSWKLAEALSEVWSVRVVVPPKGVDPDELGREASEKLIQSSPVLDATTAFASMISSRLRSKAY